MKKAYVVAEVAIAQSDAYANDYSRHVLPTLAPYGGEVLVRGGTRLQLEGEDASHHAGLRTVILEFPSLQQAHDWHQSDAYARLRTIRQQYSSGRLFIVEGS
jgi:uncharacterized protein (DUF1330 family)